MLYLLFSFKTEQGLHLFKYLILKSWNTWFSKLNSNVEKLPSKICCIVGCLASCSIKMGCQDWRRGLRRNSSAMGNVIYFARNQKEWFKLIYLQNCLMKKGQTIHLSLPLLSQYHLISTYNLQILIIFSFQIK